MRKPSNCCWRALDRLLIDECIDERFRLLFPGYDCQTARHATPAGSKNGDLLKAAEAAAFDVFVTVDQSIPDQQNMGGRKIALLILCAPANRLRDLKAAVPSAVAALRAIKP